MKKLHIALIGLTLISCNPSQRIVSEIPSYAGAYAKITIEGTDSLESLTQMTISMKEKSANHGFIFRAFNTGSTSINALWIKIAGQSAQTYFRADDIRENDKKNRVVITLLSDPNPPPINNIFDKSIVVLVEDLQDRLKLPSNKIKIERL
jgi:hypothetical protein